MNLGEYISNIIEQHGLKKNWVADQAKINYKTFIDKLNRDSFTAKELLVLGIVLNINLEQLKGDFVNEQRPND